MCWLIPNQLQGKQELCMLEKSDNIEKIFGGDKLPWSSYHVVRVFSLYHKHLAEWLLEDNRAVIEISVKSLQ
jgi:hypothetical protein